jgi:hypothetical protein
MRRGRLIVITAASTLAVVVGFLGALSYVADRRMQQVDVQGFANLLKAGVSEAVVREAGTPDEAAPRSASAGLLALPPEELKARAQLADTFVAAKTIARALVQQTNSGAKLPETSRTVTSVPRQFRIDAWGHPFCLFRISDRVVVVSAGPNHDTLPLCGELAANPSDAAHQANGLLYRYPSGRLVLALRTQLTPATADKPPAR